MGDWGDFVLSQCQCGTLVCFVAASNTVSGSGQVASDPVTVREDGEPGCARGEFRWEPVDDVVRGAGQAIGMQL